MLYLRNVSFSYGTKLILKDIDFEVKSNSTTAIIGKSGSGKSTLLKLIYGLLDANSGFIRWKDKSIQGPKYNLVPGMSFIKYLAQDFDLMPFTSVRENIGYFISNLDLEYKRNKVDELLDLVEMSEFADIKVRYLSGGQMQRVALAKVLASPPEILLLDEPFSHLDFFQKKRLSQHLFLYLRQKNICCIYVTHYPEEALMYSDQILVIENGYIVSRGKPKHIYWQKDNIETARLFGTVNEIPTRWFNSDSKSEPYLYLRPEELEVSEKGISSYVKQVFYAGDRYIIILEKESRIIEVYNNIPLEIESKVFFKKK